MEWVDSIPSVPNVHYVKCWKLVTEILNGGSVIEIILHMGFEDNFPYVLPDIYYLDTTYDYLPHIDHQTRKLCYFEDGITYNTSNCSDIVRDCIHKAKRLIEKGVNGNNQTDFTSEINSYWFARYDKESMPLFNVVFYGSFPTESTLLNLYSYKEHMTLAIKKRNVLTQREDDNSFLEYIQNKSNVSKKEALYLKSVDVEPRPPYSLSIKQIIAAIRDESDIKLFKTHLNRNRSFILVFRLFESNRFGGIMIENQPIKRKGWSSPLSAYDELIKFEKQNLPLQRFMGEMYSAEIKKRRNTETQKDQYAFTVIGLGSVGSNLCHFLMGYSQPKFVLIDDDILHSENTGRHLLGFRHIGQAKSKALQDFIKERSPEIHVNAFAENLYDKFNERLQLINDCSAIFVCIGDTMTEEFIVDNVAHGAITAPLFILWLEPFAIAGHLVYINPERSNGTICLTEGKSQLYKHNFVQGEMYETRSDEFVEQDAGCNGSYALYNQNSVTLFLSSIFPIIDELITNPSESKCYRWVGNINIASQKGISLTDSSARKGTVSELSI